MKFAVFVLLSQAFSLVAQTSQADWDAVNSLTANKNWNGAETLLRQLLTRDPRNPHLFSVLGWTLREQGRLEEAWQNAAESERRFGDHQAVLVEKGWSAFALAWRRLEENNLEEAAALTRHAVELLPASADLWNLQAVVLTRRAEYAEADVAYAEGLKLDPEHAWLPGNRRWNAWEEARAALNQKDFRQAFELSRRPLLGPGMDPFWLQWEALQALLVSEPNPRELGVFRDSLTTELLQNPGGMKDFAYVAIEVYRRTGSPDAARPFLGRLLTSATPTPWVHHIAGGTLGFFAVTQGDSTGRLNAEALEHTRRARTLWDAGRPPAAGPQNLLFPLRGRVLVTTGWDDDTVTHSGMEKYSLDFVLVDSQGRADNGNPRRPEDVLVFGTPVYAGADGEVTWAENNQPDQPMGRSGYVGNGVMIRMADGNLLNYNHLKRGSVTVRTGDRVRRGQMIGLVGNSGYSTYPHLHFSVFSSEYVTIPYAFAPPAPSAPRKNEIFTMEERP